MRVSVTDRCNFKCFYCKSRKGIHYVERDKLLTYEEIARLTSVFVGLGIKKVRITGGEPLLRRDLEQLVARIGCLRGVQDLALTTNGFNFFQKASLFKEAGLTRVTISLDSLRPERFEAMTGSKDFRKVLESIDASRDAGLTPIKINCVVVRGVNEDELLDFAHFARDKAVAVRFIEFMPIDEDEQWSRDQVVTGKEILERLQAQFRLVPRDVTDPSETARNYDFEEGNGSIGLIMPVSRPFCGQCSRIRLTADGRIRTCLFSLVEHDIKRLIRSGKSDDELKDFIIGVSLKKERGHRINEPDFVPPPRTMSYIGG